MAVEDVAESLEAALDAPPPKPLPWDHPAVLTTVLFAISVIAGAGVYLLLANAGGLAAIVALPSALAVIAPGLAGIFYGLILARRIQRGRAIVDSFETLPTPRAVLEADLSLVAANAAFRRAFGAESEHPIDVLGERLADHPAAARGFAQLRAAATSGSHAEAQLALAGPTGGRRWYNFEIDPLSGDSRRLLLRVDDVSGPKKAERFLRQELGKVETFIDNAPVGIYDVDAKGRFHYVNRSMAHWLGADGRSLVDGAGLLHGFMAAALPANTLPHDVLGGGDGAGTAAFKSRDGVRFDALVSQGPMTETPAGDSLVRTVVWNLAEIEGLEQAFGQSEQHIGTILEESPIGIALLDLEGKVTECNRAFAALAGIDRDPFEARALVDLISAEEREKISSHIEAVATGGGSDAPLEVHPGARPDVVASLYINRLTGPGKRPFGLLVHSLDTTEQSNLEIQLAQSQKMQAVGQLAGGIAHDFNNLLTAMIGFCDLLLLRHRPGEESFADVMQIKQNANRAANLVRQLLAFSRQQTLEPRVLNITDILAELTHLLRRLIGENIELDMIHGRDLGLVRVDQGQFEQVAINLVVNARDAMLLTGGTLTIRTSNVSSDDPIRRGHELMPAGDYVLAEVIDTGTGISKENIGRIFEPFYSTKEVGSGTGLGLSTVYGIVKQTGGFIFVDSEIDKGAKFSIFLPRHDKQDDAKARKKAKDSEEDRRDLTGVGTVLLVEDEDAVRLFGARALRNKGYKVMEATSGEEALEFMKEGADPVDLLITDIVMPNMDGPSLIREVREMHPDLKVICISGYAEDAFRKRLDRSADIHFLPKPFSLQQLAGKVKDVLQAEGG